MNQAQARCPRGGKGERYTLSESARRTVLDRLVALNPQRYEKEVKAGLRENGAKKGKARKTKPPTVASPQTELLRAPQKEWFE